MRLIGMINAYLQEKQSHCPQRSYFHVSEAGMTPYEAFKSITMPESHTPRMKRALHNGRDVHRRIRQYLVTPQAERDLAKEADILNQFLLKETEGFFERMLGVAKAIGKEAPEQEKEE
jgi:hypothetical protein